MVIGVLVPTFPGPPQQPPEQRPLGRAALALADEGIVLVMGDTVRQGHMIGHIARPGGWEPADLPAAAFYDRFPSQRRASVYANIVANLAGRPLGNSPQTTALCRDKLATQRALEAAGLQMPAVEDDPDRFASRLADWGAAFIKPRFGALGAGVRRVQPGDPLPARLRALLDDEEPALLQRAVPPPAGLAGRSVRVLAQRDVDGSWVQAPGVVRDSHDDPVVNAARGAQVGVAQDLLAPHSLRAIAAAVDATCRAIADRPGGDLALELGVDLVLDPDGVPHLIEVNSRPRGRLEKLADRAPARFGDLHVAACARPIRTLAAWAG